RRSRHEGLRALRFLGPPGCGEDASAARRNTLMLYGAVLAGGRSSRMGRDKALLRLDGRTLLARSRDILEQAGADRVFISGRPEEEDGIADLLPHAGPPGGLYSVLAHLRRKEGLDGSPLLLIPVDMPYLEVEAVARLPQALGGAAAARYQDEVFPCVFRATAALHAHLREIFEEAPELGGKRSMKALLAWTEAVTVAKNGLPDTMFMNV